MNYEKLNTPLSSSYKINRILNFNRHLPTKHSYEKHAVSEFRAYGIKLIQTMQQNVSISRTKLIKYYTYKNNNINKKK